MQGWREQMEDDHVQLLSLSPDLPDLSLFGVFDGHGGAAVAHYMKKHFLRHLLKANKLTTDQSRIQEQAKEAFETALISIDDELRPPMPRGHAEPSERLAIENGRCGSTAVMTLISPTHVICSNTGDSRAVLSRGGQAVALSDDHKPDNPGERERIESAGCQVTDGRVNGLAVSYAQWSHMCGGPLPPGRPRPHWLAPGVPFGPPLPLPLVVRPVSARPVVKSIRDSQARRRRL